MRVKLAAGNNPKVNLWFFWEASGKTIVKLCMRSTFACEPSERMLRLLTFILCFS